MASPFRDYQKHLSSRYEKIGDEVEVYYLDDTENELPDALFWLLKIESYGLLFPGPYIKQPYHFMRDVEAARSARMRADLNRDINAKQESHSPNLEDIKRKLGGGVTYG